MACLAVDGVESGTGNPAQFVDQLASLSTVPQFMRKQALLREFVDDQTDDDLYNYFLWKTVFSSFFQYTRK